MTKTKVSKAKGEPLCSESDGRGKRFALQQALFSPAKARSEGYMLQGRKGET